MDETEMNQNAFRDYADDSFWINGFLLYGDKFLEDQFYPRMKNREERLQKKKKQVIDQIKYMDDHFLNHLERNDTDGLVVYRGMDSIDFRMQDVTKPSRASSEDWFSKSTVLERNEPIEVLNYVSTSTDIDTAHKFMWPSKCCLYELHIQKGIPIINMSGGDRSESEILLPRNLLFSYVETKHIEGIDNDVIVMNVIMKNENQFNPSVEESKRNEITLLKTTKSKDSQSDNLETLLKPSKNKVKSPKAKKKKSGDSDLKTVFKLSKEHGTLPSDIKTFSQFVSGGDAKAKSPKATSAKAKSAKAKSPKAKKSRAKKSPGSKINMTKELRQAYALFKEYGTLPSDIKNFSQFYSARKYKKRKIKIKPAVAFQGKHIRF
jgi:hypothetical protein